MRTVAFTAACLCLLSGCGSLYQPYLQSLQVKALLPPTCQFPITSNEPRLEVSGEVVAGEGEQIAYSNNQNFVDTASWLTGPEYERGYENVAWTTPELTGALHVTYLSRYHVYAGGSAAVARIHGDYCIGLYGSVGTARVRGRVGFKAGLVAGSCIGRTEAVVLLHDMHYYDEYSDSRFTEADKAKLVLGFRGTLNTTRPRLCLIYGAGLAIDALFQYYYRDNSDAAIYGPIFGTDPSYYDNTPVYENWLVLSPTVFAARSWRGITVTAGYTLASIVTIGGGSQAFQSEGWLRFGYAFGFEGGD
jgi:hypothetical protein